MKINIDLAERMVYVVSQHQSAEPDMKGVRKAVQDLLKEHNLYGMQVWRNSTVKVEAFANREGKYYFEIHTLFDLIDPFGRLGNPMMSAFIGEDLTITNAI